MRDFTSEHNKKYFGSNLEKAKANHDKELKRAKAEFAKQYPYANLSDFKFWVLLSKNREISCPTEIYYIDKTDRTNWEVTSEAFNDFYSSTLYWGPTKIWDPSLETTHHSLVNDGKSFPFDPKHFRIFVNSEQSFSFETTALNTKWVNSRNAKDIRKVNLDKDDPYFASLMAAYVISQKTGICTRHLTESMDVPKIVTSIFRFYVWYHMRRLLRYPEKMTKYLTKKNLDFIKGNLPVRKIWKKKYHHGKETVSAWLKTQPNKANIRNAKIYEASTGAPSE